MEDEAAPIEENQDDQPVVENETDGKETACYRKCHGLFCLTDEENHFQHEISLDFSPFLSSLSKYPSATYTRIESLLKLDHSIDRVKQLITKKHITCIDLCLFYLKRVQSTNDYHKVILELNPHLLEDAKRLDEQIDNAEMTDKPLFGCVAAIKGNIAVKDLYNDAGAYVLHEKKMSGDAPVVKKLRQQGTMTKISAFVIEGGVSLNRLSDSGSNQSL